MYIFIKISYNLFGKIRNLKIGMKNKTYLDRWYYITHVYIIQYIIPCSITHVVLHILQLCEDY